MSSIYSNNGSNFTGAKMELEWAYSEMTTKYIHSWRYYGRLDQMEQTPFLWKAHGWNLSEKNLFSTWKTYLFVKDRLVKPGKWVSSYTTEVENILNYRNMTLEMIIDPGNLQPLPPANIINMKLKVVVPPTRKFIKPELCCRRRWRRVQQDS